MNNNTILFECASKPPQEVDSIGFASDAHWMRIKSMRIHVNVTDPDWMRIQCASRCPCESALSLDVSKLYASCAHILPVLSSKGTFTWTPWSESLRIQSGLYAFTWIRLNPMRIKCALSPIYLWRWIGSGLKLDYIIIHDLREVMPTMRSLACSLAWLFVACGACYIASFCSALAATLGKK